jgi:hypothetical protein
MFNGAYVQWRNWLSGADQFDFSIPCRGLPASVALSGLDGIVLHFKSRSMQPVSRVKYLACHLTFGFTSEGPDIRSDGDGNRNVNAWYLLRTFSVPLSG